MRPFAFLLAVGSLLTLSLPAQAQWSSRYQTCPGGNCGSVTRSYSGPLVDRTVTRTVTPSYATSAPSTASYASSASTYSVGDEGQVLASNGDVVKSVGGVEVVAKDWAMNRIATAEDAAMSFASIPSCECPDYSAQFKEISERLDRIERNQRTYSEQHSQHQQQIEQRLAKLAADRAATMARLNRDGGLAVR